LLDLFGVRWILSDRQLELPAVTDVTPADSVGLGLFLYRRDQALPRAFLVGRARVEPDPTARLQALGAPDFDPAAVVLLEDASAPVPGDPLGDHHVRITGLRDQEVVVETQGDHDAYLVLSDPWHPGWEAEVDGVRQPLLIANHAVRAVFVAKGSHRVRFLFRPASFTLGLLASGFGLLLSLGLLLWRPQIST
jgi:hypothetical protein